MSSETKVSYDLKRFAGIKRDYTPQEVDRLRGSIKIEYSMCKNQSENLFWAIIFKPASSILALIFPVIDLLVASGLIIDKVCSIDIKSLLVKV